MAIQSVGNTDLDNNVIIPLGVNAAQGEQITISKVESTLAANVQVYLEDNVASTTTSLNSGDYVITPNTALSGTGRFYLRFESDTLSEEESELNGLQIFNTANPKVLHIKGLITEASTISIYDILGRDILTQDLSTNVNSQEVNISNLGIGTYIVEISNDFGTRTKKIIVME